MLLVRALFQLETNTGRDAINLDKKVNWLLGKNFEIKCEDKWLSHQLEPVLENEKCKILWDFAIQVDQEKEHRRPDIVVITNYANFNCYN